MQFRNHYEKDIYAKLFDFSSLGATFNFTPSLHLDFAKCLRILKPWQPNIILLQRP